MCNNVEKKNETRSPYKLGDVGSGNSNPKTSTRQLRNKYQWRDADESVEPGLVQMSINPWIPASLHRTSRARRAAWVLMFGGSTKLFADLGTT